MSNVEENFKEADKFGPYSPFGKSKFQITLCGHAVIVGPKEITGAIFWNHWNLCRSWCYGALGFEEIFSVANIDYTFLPLPPIS